MIALGVPVDRTKVKNAIAAARFEKMKDVEIVGGIPGHIYDRNDSGSRRMREGKVHGFTEHLSAENIDYITTYCETNLNSASRQILDRCTLS